MRLSAAAAGVLERGRLLPRFDRRRHPDAASDGRAGGQVLQASEDASVFSPATLAGVDAMVWLSTTGDVLNAEQEAAFEPTARGR
jgi:hypothetical protein